MKGCSVQFLHSVMSNSLRPHGPQHARLPCLSPTLGACSSLCPFSRWCCPTISSSVIPFSSCLQSLPASQSFPRSQFFASGGQIPSKGLNYLINITKRCKIYILKATKHCKKKWNNPNKWKELCSWLEDLIFLRWPFSPKQSIFNAICINVQWSFL